MEKDPYACITAAIWERAKNCRSDIVYLSPNDPRLVEAPLGAIKSVLAGLENTKKIEILKRPLGDPVIRRTEFEGEFYTMRILPDFPTVETLSKDAAEIIGTTNRINMDDVALTISYNPGTGVIINRLFGLTKPQAGSENERMLEFWIEHPNQEFSKSEIEQRICRKLKKDFYDIARGLGLENDLIRVFFPKISRDCVRFNNPVTWRDIQRLGISTIRISSGSSKSVKKKSDMANI